MSKLKQFKLTASVGVSAYTVVEAKSLKEAIAEAEGRDVVLGGTGSGAEETEQWVIDEPDGMPLNIKPF
jgi:hypothetical protein